MPLQSKTDELCLLVRAGDQLCAIPLEHVSETMRPLPVRQVAELPHFVCGVTVVRGVPVPVVHAASILGATHASSAETRWVTLKVAARIVALAVEQVVGVRHIGRSQVSSLPPLLATGSHEVVSMLGIHDADLLMVLSCGRLVPPALWNALEEVPST